MSARRRVRVAPARLEGLGISRGLLKLLIGLVVLGSVLAWYGFREVRLRGMSHAEPQTLSCRALQDDGPAGNAHVRLTDFLLLVDAFVVQQKGVAGGYWSKAWVPAVPLDGPFAAAWIEAPEGEKLPPPKDLGVLVQLGAGNEGTLIALAQKDVLQGTVINEVGSLDEDVVDILRDSYPGLDPRKCWVLEVDRAPKSAGGAWAMFVGGLLVILGALAGGVFAHLAAKRAVENERRFEERRMRARAAALEQSGGDPDEDDPA